MAYLNYIASIPESQIRDFQARAIGQLSPALLARTTHGLVSYFDFEPLRILIEEALDGGSVLRADFWHPLRPPHVHTVAEVVRIYPLLREADERFLESLPPEYREVSQMDIQPLIDVFAHAASHGFCVVSALEPPHDAERASRVMLPFSV
jgi:hypothetical protein